MAYIALYRAYRPQKFSEVVGQEHIIKTLQNAIKMNKVAHAYLFCGPRGTGKTTFAKILAKAMNCEHGPTVEPCCECEMCKGIAKGIISDVVEIDAASNNGADDIRALRDTVNFMPAQGKYKIYIIDEVHMLSNAAFNALLKTLEEPPKHVIFILATTEPYKLPPTILSRCQRFDFQSISIDDILKRLNVVKDSEGIKIEDEALYQIAVSAEGGMRDALSLLDQAVSYSVNDVISLDDVLSISGNTSYNKIIELLDACIGEDETKAIIILDKILKEGKEVPRLINDIILFLRDLLLYKNNTILEEKIMYKNDNFISLAHKLSKNTIYSWLDILNETLNNSKFSVQKRAFLELAILKMNDNKLNEEASLLDRVVSLERNFEMLSRQMLERPQEIIKNINPNLPTKEELNKLKEDNYRQPQKEENIVKADIEVTKEVQKDIKVEERKEDILRNIEPAYEEETKTEPLNDEITISDIEKIIYNSEPEKKEALMVKWNKIAETYTSFLELQMMVCGKIAAISKKKIIVILNDVSFCNRVMQYQNYLKIMEIFHENDIDVDDYICLPVVVWRDIMSEYKAKRTPDNPKPELSPRHIGVKRRIEPTNNIEYKKEKAVEEELKELFPENEIKIVEE